GSAMTFTPDGKHLVTGGTDGQTVCIWDTATGRLVDELPEPPTVMCSHCAADPAGLLAIATSAHTVCVMNYPATKEWRGLGRLDHAISGLAISPTGTTLAAADECGGVCLWDLSNERQLVRLRVKGEFAQVAFAADGKQLAVATRERLILLDTATGK